MYLLYYYYTVLGELNFSGGKFVCLFTDFVLTTLALLVSLGIRSQLKVVKSCSCISLHCFIFLLSVLGPTGYQSNSECRLHQQHYHILYSASTNQMYVPLPCSKTCCEIMKPHSDDSCVSESLSTADSTAEGLEETEPLLLV